MREGRGGRREERERKRERERERAREQGHVAWDAESVGLDVVRAGSRVSVLTVGLQVNGRLSPLIPLQ